MCGILGYTGERPAVEVLLRGLEPLEYRGYDSTGLCVADEAGLRRFRAVGPLEHLHDLIAGGEPSNATAGIGHTRWATHGGVKVENAHPFLGCGDRGIAIVLNGVIENYLLLRQELEAAGHVFESETDAEAVVHLLEDVQDLQTARGEDLVGALRQVVPRLEGQFAIVAAHSDRPTTLVGARRGCPLLVGRGERETYLASSVTSFAEHTRQVVLLEDDEVVRVDGVEVHIVGPDGAPVSRSEVEIEWDGDAADRQGHDSFMRKEILEQPEAVAHTLDRLLESPATGGIDAHALPDCSQLIMVGCGTSLHAAELGAHLFEQWSILPCRVEVASEWRYRDPVVPPGALVIGLSQSGETADTIAALRRARAMGVPTLAVTNSAGSQITREVDQVVLTRAGLEMGVAASKTFAAQVAALGALALRLAEARQTLLPGRADELEAALHSLPTALADAMDCEDDAAALATALAGERHFMFLGRNAGLAACREGALKLSEITYVPTTALPAGEMKHGPIALIGEGTPVISVCIHGAAFEKMAANLSEVRARGARVVVIVPRSRRRTVSPEDHVVVMPDAHPLLQPVVAVVAMQWLAYHLAKQLGYDVDRPRNLAKTVTVE